MNFFSVFLVIVEWHWNVRKKFSFQHSETRFVPDLWENLRKNWKRTEKSTPTQKQDLVTGQIAKYFKVWLQKSPSCVRLCVCVSVWVCKLSRVWLFFRRYFKSEIGGESSTAIDRTGAGLWRGCGRWVATGKKKRVKLRSEVGYSAHIKGPFLPA